MWLNYAWYRNKRKWNKLIYDISFCAKHTLMQLSPRNGRTSKLFNGVMSDMCITQWVNWKYYLIITEWRRKTFELLRRFYKRRWHMINYK